MAKGNHSTSSVTSDDLRFYSLPRHHLLRLAEPIRELLAAASYSLPQGSSVSIKSLLQSLLPKRDETKTQYELRKEVRDFILCCAAICAAEGDDSPTLFWVPRDLILAAKSALEEFSKAASFESEREMMMEGFMPELLPVVKSIIKETCVSTDEEGEDFVAASAKAPVAYAIVASHQFRWIVSQVGYPHLGKLLWLVMPCALTALDHWSAEVKDQALVSLLHIGKNVNATELSWHEEPILDACCRNIPAVDELWGRVVEMSVFLLTSTQRMNPRSPWFERILNEMLSHLERQPYNKERRIPWLTSIEPVFDAMGLFILVHFQRIFNIFFQWIHMDDEETVYLVLERLKKIIKLTWIRKSLYHERLVDELVLLYKELAIRRSRELLRNQILQLLLLLEKCKGLQFEAAWNKHRSDPDLTMLISSFNNLLSQTG